MTFDHQTTRELVAGVAQAVIAATSELTDLDQAIGDGDHGINMKRGCQAVLQKLDSIGAMPPGLAFAEVGKTLIMTIGGASGPLYGKLFSALGQSLGDPDSITQARFVAGCEEAIKVIKSLGKSDVGQKTMLDVLVPVLDELRAGSGHGLLARVRERAGTAAAATVPMLATRGRASFLGERSRGHMDPGARSSELIIEAACAYLEKSALGHALGQV
jgi:phosphoenolpyruvate---glycerone phosphotransferase subunit DhaL